MIIKGSLDHFNGISYGLVALEMNHPGVYIMTGDNGIGKTTFIKGIIFGNHKEIIFSDTYLREEYLKFRYRLISYLPQNMAQSFYTVEVYLMKAIKKIKQGGLLI